jgi:hypothetical protein
MSSPVFWSLLGVLVFVVALMLWDEHVDHAAREARKDVEARGKERDRL